MRRSPAAGILDQLDHLGGIRLLVRQIREHHIGAFPGERNGHRPTDAGVGTGDDRLAAGQPARPDIGILAVVGFGFHRAGQSGRRLRLLGLRWGRILGGRINLVVLRLSGHDPVVPGRWTPESQDGYSPVRDHRVGVSR